MSTIGSRIRERRLALGLSVDELAVKLGKNRATVYRYESDEIENFPISIIAPLSEVLRTTPAYLMGWTETTPTWEDEFCTRIIEHMENAHEADLEAAGINKEEVLAIVEGKKGLSLESACNIADQFGLSIDALVGRDSFSINVEKPATIADDELNEIASIFLELSPDNRAKLIELSRLYLSSQRSSE